jgi:hypothetical protein
MKPERYHSAGNQTGFGVEPNYGEDSPRVKEGGVFY